MCKNLFRTRSSLCEHQYDSGFVFCVYFFSPLQAIESFAVTVKDIAQMLQSFGTELAEAELSDEGKAIEYLLVSHTEKYRKLKVRFFSVFI